ncbi:hypothetical protein MTX78_01355 [Hymenobacter tibetensis]|uniref:Uncharacterized protein n=1 Tax=Hymenobacter tibetensis TaxID=497967 RepID=A0ABY4CZ15_9BACT|nr:hypothetical protein [Hymenobacter tibetensis]UOG75257.1 hypothetical protein MTX78_01355 [Hymenobacter tibetensis]
MSKGKKKDSKKGNQSNDLLDEAAVSLKKFRKVTKQLTKLTTGQKVVGGLALLAAGLTYLAKQQGETDAAVKTTPGAEAAEAALATLTNEHRESEPEQKGPDPIRKPAKAASRHKKPKRTLE